MKDLFDINFINSSLSQWRKCKIHRIQRSGKSNSIYCHTNHSFDSIRTWKTLECRFYQMDIQIFV